MSARWTWPEHLHGEVSRPTDRVDCWMIPLADLAREAEPAAMALLSAEERQRAERFHFERHRRAYVGSHAALRLLLARYLRIAPASLAIVPDENGRPVLANSDGRLHFNLSHSSDVALVAVSSVAPVGVDVEAVKLLPDFVAIARTHFAAAEVEGILQLPPDQRIEGFFVTWTRKEAFVKALGLGLSFPLDAFSTGWPDQPPRLAFASGAATTEWSLVDLVSAGAFRAAVAIGFPAIAIDRRMAAWSWLFAGIQVPALISASAVSTAVRS